MISFWLWCRVVISNFCDVLTLRALQIVIATNKISFLQKFIYSGARDIRSIHIYINKAGRAIINVIPIQTIELCDTGLALRTFNFQRKQYWILRYWLPYTSSRIPYLALHTLGLLQSALTLRTILNIISIIIDILIHAHIISIFIKSRSILAWPQLIYAVCFLF